MSKGIYERKKVNVEDRFWSKVDIKSEDECWLWKAHCNPDGYGRFSINGKVILAHRFVWTLYHGDIKEGLCILHTCDIRPCCNPNHLWDGTNADNTNDMIIKGRQRPGSLIGSRNASHKLNEEDVICIRIMRQCGFTEPFLSELYDVCRGTISKLSSRETWKHI
jgi:hypothetical protein